MAKQLRVEIVGDAASLEKALRRAGASSGQFGGVTSTLRSQMIGLGKAFVGTAVAFKAGEFLKTGIESAEALKKAQDSLRVSIEKTGGSVSKLLPQYTATAREAARFGVSQKDATVALSRATLLTGDASKAQAAYQEALVISKATGKDFGAVLTATSKAQIGVTTGLRRYGILVDKNSTSQEQLNQVMGRFGGQAEANTSASDKLHANFQNLQTSIGTLLLPAFEKIVGGLNSVVTWLQSSQVSAAFSSFASTAKSLMQPIIDWVRTNWPQIKTTIESVMQGVKDVITNIVAIVRALWDTFGGAILQITRTTFQTIFAVVGDLMRAIRDTIRLITDIIHGHWSAAWDDLKGIVSNVLGAAVALVRGYIDNFATAALAIGKAFVKAIASGLAAMGGAIAGAVLGPLDGVIGKIREVIGWAHDALSAIGSVFSSGGPAPPANSRIPKVGGARAAGGPVTAGVPYIVGENRPELFVPDTNGRILSSVPSMVGAGGAGIVFNIYASAPNYLGDKAAVARELGTEIANQLRGNGIPALTTAIRAT